MKQHEKIEIGDIVIVSYKPDNNSSRKLRLRGTVKQILPEIQSTGKTIYVARIDCIRNGYNFKAVDLVRNLYLYKKADSNNKQSLSYL